MQTFALRAGRERRKDRLRNIVLLAGMCKPCLVAGSLRCRKGPLRLCDRGEHSAIFAVRVLNRKAREGILRFPQPGRCTIPAPPLTQSERFVSALPQDDTRVVCASCRYRYSSVRGFCPICGAPAPAEDSVPVIHEVSNRNKRGWGGDESEFASHSRLRVAALIGILAAVLFSAWYFLRSDGEQNPSAILPAPVTAPVASPPASQPPATPTVEPSQPQSIRPEARPATPRAAQPDITSEDPAELWKRVGHGDMAAEVALARLYLDGTRVPQSCEQARLLLTAAAEKHQAEAVRLLAGDYAQRCR